jgi:methylase of polypeptide subunit release factors
MISQNDPTAKVFDIVYGVFTNKAETKREVGFIASQLNKSKPILDLGCGSGRHTIPLLKKGCQMNFSLSTTTSQRLDGMRAQSFI